MIIYNLFPLLAGQFGEWEEHLRRASRMGFDWVFVNPVQQPGGSGSLYAVADYFALNPLFTDSTSKKSARKQLEEAIETARKLGLKVMIDLVINHCAVDSPLLKSHPEWFAWKARGQVAHPYCDEDGKRVVWKDLAKFDHQGTRDKEGLYRFLVSVVKFLIDLGFTGFRCDAAYQVPRSIWERLICEIKKDHPQVLFVAETLGCQPEQTRKTAAAGFDYIFNSSKWWDFHSSWLMKQYILTRELVPSIGFPESHDTVRLCEEMQGNLEGVKQRYLFAALFATGVMMPIGFEFGFRKKLHVIKTKPTDWEETGIDLTGFIACVNAVKAQNMVFQEEALTEIEICDNPNVLVLWKGATRTKQEALLVLNKDRWNRQQFHAPNLYDYIESSGPLVDVSPGSRLDYLPTPFHYELHPGEALVFVTEARPADNEP